MILGIDVGNYSLKVAPNLNIRSLVTNEENLLGSRTNIEMDGLKHIIGEGKYEMELNKSIKENYLPLLFTGIALSSKDTFNQIVVGLPINQYKNNKLQLEELLLDNKSKEIKINGVTREIVINDFKVYPEGVGAYYSLGTNEDCIIVDIGGRTTDIAYISDGKLKESSTKAVGTLNIFSEISNVLNTEYTLNTDLHYAERILSRGYLQINGEEADLSFITDILKDNFRLIKDELDLKYQAKTEKLILVGGGARIFKRAFEKRYRNCRIADDPVYANSKGFKKVGEMLWG